MKNCIYIVKIVNAEYYRYYFSLNISFSLFQLLKNEIWRARGLSGGQSTSCLSSIVLDTSNELLHKKSDKDNRFVYSFVRQDIPSPNSIGSNGESLNAVSFPANDLVCTLRSGDYVVCYFK